MTDFAKQFLIPHKTWLTDGQMDVGALLGVLQSLPVEILKLQMLERLYLDNNKIAILPVELGQLMHLHVLHCDHNSLVSIPGTHVFKPSHHCNPDLARLKCHWFLSLSLSLSHFDFYFQLCFWMMVNFQWSHALTLSGCRGAAGVHRVGGALA